MEIQTCHLHQLLFGNTRYLDSFLLAYLLGNKTGMWLVNKLHQQKNARFAKQVLKNNGLDNTNYIHDG